VWILSGSDGRGNGGKVPQLLDLNRHRAVELATCHLKGSTVGARLTAKDLPDREASLYREELAIDHAV
jgi:hypothetical protein